MNDQRRRACRFTKVMGFAMRYAMHYATCYAIRDACLVLNLEFGYPSWIDPRLDGEEGEAILIVHFSLLTIPFVHRPLVLARPLDPFGHRP